MEPSSARPSGGVFTESGNRVVQWLPQWALQEGGYGLAVLLVVAFVVALSRGIIVRRGEVERIERRIEKDTDRILDLYKAQLDLAAKANEKKDETIARQAEQIEKLMSHSAVTSHAFAEIMEEARRRGLVE